MKGLFGSLQGPELTTSWIVAVFGSWFILVIPFMRKKEQIWKRLNSDQERAVDAWFVGVGIFIGLLITSSLFWSLVFRARLHGVNGQGMDALWAKAVLGSWLVILLPCLILMYRKADTIFKDAVERQTYIPKFKSICIEGSQRFLPLAIVSKIKAFPQTLPGAHVVTVLLKDGRRVPHVFVLSNREILGIYGQSELSFVASDVEGVEMIEKEALPAYEESEWLRLDGKS